MLPETIKIPLSQNKIAVIDASDLPLVSPYKWYFDHGYARTETGGPKIYMHRLLLDMANKSAEVDHINGDKLDNRRCNLRICTHGENVRNRRGVEGTSSAYKGVYRRGKYGWVSRIGVNTKKINLGIYDSEEEAARVYDIAAKKFFGEFARTNLKEGY